MNRKDKKGRVLREGESQRQDGRYVYKYRDALGEVHFVYSWKLERYDNLPKGKRNCISLREKEKEIQRDLQDGISTNGGNLTVYELVELYSSQKQGIKKSTYHNYKTVLNLLKNDSLGKQRIKNVNLLVAQNWCISLKQKGISYGTIKIYRGIIKPAFQLAVNNDLIRKNPFNFSLSSIIRNDARESIPLTQKQEESLLAYLKSTCLKKYYDEIYILLNTGLRISEFCGLTKKDIDFENHFIDVNHQLQIVDGKTYIEPTPKTKAGARQIPMTEEVEQSIMRVLAKRKPKIEPIIDGYTGFVFLNNRGTPLNTTSYYHRIKTILKRYNNNNDLKIEQLTPHILRHTFCSKMIRQGMNPKVLQIIMGHEDISITMNLYTHLTAEDTKEEMKKIVSN